VLEARCHYFSFDQVKIIPLIKSEYLCGGTQMHAYTCAENKCLETMQERNIFSYLFQAERVYLSWQYVALLTKQEYTITLCQII
jgi:hypothetical protein